MDGSFLGIQEYIVRDANNIALVECSDLQLQGDGNKYSKMFQQISKFSVTF